MLIKDRIKTKLTEAKKLQTQLAKQVEWMAKENAAFAAMSDADKRVAIAKDVIAQVRSGALAVQTSTGYVRLGDYVTPTEDGEVNENTELKQVLCDQECCTVCARGAMFVAGVKRFNNLTLADLGITNGDETDYLEDSDIEAYEDNFFSPAQIDAIESYFEGGERGCDSDAAYAALNAGREQFDGDEDNETNTDWYGGDDTLLIAIMKNIIDNKGTFVPEKMEREVKRAAFYSAQKKRLGKKKGAK